MATIETPPFRLVSVDATLVEATACIARREPVPAHMVRAILGDLRDNDDVYNFLKLLCEQENDDISALLLEAVLASSNRDCTFVFQHSAWAADGAAEQAIATITSQPLVSKLRVSYMACLTKLALAQPGTAATWVLHAIEYYTRMEILPAGFRRVAHELLAMALAYKVSAPLTSILKLAPHSVANAFALIGQDLGFTCPEDALVEIMVLAVAHARLGATHVNVLNTMAQLAAIRRHDYSPMIDAVTATRYCGQEELACLRAMLSANEGRKPYGLSLYVSCAMQHYLEKVIVEGIVEGDAIHELLELALEHVPATSLVVSRVVALAERSPAAGTRLMSTLDTVQLAPHCADIASAIVERALNHYPEGTALLYDLSRDYPLEMADAVTDMPGSLLPLWLHTNCLWLVPMAAMKLACSDVGGTTPVRALMEDDLHRAVTLGVFTYCCGKGRVDQQELLLPLGAVALDVVDKHTLVYHLATGTYAGDHVQLMAQTCPDVVDRVTSRANEEQVTRVRRWIRRRTWILTARTAMRWGRGVRRTTKPAPGFKGVAGTLDLVKLIATYL